MQNSGNQNEENPDGSCDGPTTRGMKSISSVTGVTGVVGASGETQVSESDTDATLTASSQDLINWAFTGEIRIDANGKVVSQIGGISLECLMAGSSRLDDYLFRLGIAIKFMQTTKLTACKFLQNDKKNRRKADKAYKSLFSLLVELHKVSFNLHYMLAQLEINEWGLTEDQFNHIFHELRDGSWNMNKLLDNTLSTSELFRKYMLILDVYSKVFIDEFFINWRFIVQLVSDRKKSVMAQELIAFENNFGGIKNKYDYIKHCGYMPQPNCDEVERFYEAKKAKFYEGNQRTVSPGNWTMLEDVFGDRFCKSNFLPPKTMMTGSEDKENDENVYHDMDPVEMMATSQDTENKKVNVGTRPGPYCQCKKGKLEKVFEAHDEDDVSDVQNSDDDENKENCRAGNMEQEKSEDEYYTGVDE